jgi:hypothetical protein
MQNIVAGPSYILHLYNLWLIPIITLATSHKKKDGLTFLRLLTHLLIYKLEIPNATTTY